MEMKFKNVKTEKVDGVDTPVKVPVRFDSPNGHHEWKWVKPGEIIDYPNEMIDYLRRLGFEQTEEPVKIETVKSEIGKKSIETKMKV
jgi:hypothetical protein